MSGLSEQLMRSEVKATVIDGVCELVEREVAGKRGLTGVAVKAGFAVVTRVKPGFIREVVTKRWDRARTYLVDPDAMSNTDVEALQKEWGDPSTVEAEIVSRTDERASVNVTLKTEKGTEVVAFELVFDDEWKIALP